MHPYTQKYDPKIRKKPRARDFIRYYLKKDQANEHVRVEWLRPSDADIVDEAGDDEKHSEEDGAVDEGRPHAVGFEEEAMLMEI